MEQPKTFPVYFTDGRVTYKLIAPNEYIEIVMDDHQVTIEHDHVFFANTCPALVYWNTPNYQEMDEEAFLDVFRIAQGRVSKSILRDGISQINPTDIAQAQYLEAEILEEIGEVYQPII